MMMVPRRWFVKMLAALPIVIALPLTKLLPEETRLIWASGGTVSDHDVEIIPGGVRINWGSLLNRNNNLDWAEFSDGRGTSHVWRDEKWSDGTPEILLDVTIPEEETDSGSAGT